MEVRRGSGQRSKDRPLHLSDVRPQPRNHGLAYYLDEFTFRFNRRKSASRGEVFYRLVQQAKPLARRTHRVLSVEHK